VFQTCSANTISSLTLDKALSYFTGNPYTIEQREQGHFSKNLNSWAPLEKTSQLIKYIRKPRLFFIVYDVKAKKICTEVHEGEYLTIIITILNAKTNKEYLNL
jgi:hypothetical protein